MRRFVSVVMLAGVVGLVASLGQRAGAQSQQPVVVPVEYPDEFHVNYVNGECTQSLVVPSANARAALARFYVSYYRSEGCLWWPLDREMDGLRTSLDVLLKALPDRARLTGVYFGRVLQPEFRLRIANASLERGLEALPNERGFYRRVRAALDEADVFRELRELFALHGFKLSVRSLEKIERIREIEMAQWAVDPKHLVKSPAATARIPIAAIVWFDVGPM